MRSWLWHRRAPPPARACPGSSRYKGVDGEPAGSLVDAGARSSTSSCLGGSAAASAGRVCSVNDDMANVRAESAACAPARRYRTSSLIHPPCSSPSLLAPARGQGAARAPASGPDPTSYNRPAGTDQRRRCRGASPSSTSWTSACTRSIRCGVPRRFSETTGDPSRQARPRQRPHARRRICAIPVGNI